MFSQSANFDFLRANGVLMVIAFHVLAFFGIRKAGPFDLEAMAFAGFLFFFVHSSFVLMLSLERLPSPDSGGTIEGQKTWHDNANQPHPSYQGTSTVLPMFTALVVLWFSSALWFFRHTGFPQF